MPGIKRRKGILPWDYSWNTDERIVKLRKELGMSISEISKALDISEEAILDYESRINNKESHET